MALSNQAFLISITRIYSCWVSNFELTDINIGSQEDKHHKNTFHKTYCFCYILPRLITQEDRLFMFFITSLIKMAYFPME